MKRSMLALLLTGGVLGATTEAVAQAGGGAPTRPAAAAPDGSRSGGQATWTPKRINKVIELLQMGEPVYYTQVDGGGYEEGKQLAKTEADYITYNLEHSSFDMTRLREFMRGLVDGGPTRSGHRTPAVIVVTPSIGWDQEAMRANQWMLQHVMSAGVHGILLPHAVDPTAVKLMIEALRYPFAPVVAGLGQGRQGNGSQSFAAGIWGLSSGDYLQKADPWPLNPNGEFFIGLKIENIHGVQNAEQLVRVPGVGFAEWGPGDQGFWMGAAMGLTQPAPGNTPELQQIRQRVLKATKDSRIFFLNSCSGPTVKEMIDEGVRICTGGGTEASRVGREYTKRQMPW